MSAAQAAIALELVWSTPMDTNYLLFTYAHNIEILFTANKK